MKNQEKATELHCPDLKTKYIFKYIGYDGLTLGY